MTLDMRAPAEPSGLQEAPTAAPPRPRPYQTESIEAARKAFASGARGVLIVLPTGSGKTIVIGEVARMAIDRGGRVLVLAHRSELIAQAREKIEAAAPGVRVDLEQAEHRAASDAGVVVASVASLRGARLERWAPDAFSLVIVDEAHHATAEGYRRIFRHFDRARVLGFTATPDRADGTALREVFDVVAYSRTMLDLMREGFLAPLIARTIRVEAFDLAGSQVVGGDVDEGDIARALGRPGVLDAMAEMLIEHTGQRSTIVFVAGVARAHELAQLLEQRGHAAASIDGTTPAADRRATFDAFAGGRVRFLVNVGVATEGTDLPRCSCVAIARPTMSRALFVQMTGRGVRPFGAWGRDEPATSEARKLAIASSAKPDCLLLNFAPSNARHRLMVAADAMLDGNTDAPSIEHGAGDVDVMEAAEGAIRAKREKRIGRYTATIEAFDPFGALGPIDVASADEGGPVDPRAVDRIIALGIPAGDAVCLSPAVATAVLAALLERRRAGLCSFKIARQLVRFRLNPNVSNELGRHAMTLLEAVRWRGAPKALRDDPRFALPDRPATVDEAGPIADALLRQLRGAA